VGWLRIQRGGIRLISGGAPRAKIKKHYFDWVLTQKRNFDLLAPPVGIFTGTQTECGISDLTNKNKMKTQNIGWQVSNGSGWNHHKTADALNSILAAAPDTLPALPLGYGVLVAPISDKPFGLRCALVRELPRKLSPIISIHHAGGNYVQHPEVVKYDALRMADVEGDGVKSLLAEHGYQPTSDRPAGWPARDEWYRHADGTWASVEMCDDGPDGDADGWARDRFDLDVEIIKSVKADQQSDDDSTYFINAMAEAIAAITAPN
jgi:hypothetical protein